MFHQPCGKLVNYNTLKVLTVHVHVHVYIKFIMLFTGWEVNICQKSQKLPKPKF